MAVTIYDEPQVIAPAGNPLVFTFSSNQTAQPNFSFVVELYIDSTLRLTQEVFRQFNTLGRIDVSEAVQSAIRNPEITTDLEFDATNSMVSYFIIVYEKYGTTPIIQASDTSTTLKAFNAALEYPEWRVWDDADYNPNVTQGSLFLTYFPRTSRQLCGMNENVYVGYLESTGGAGVVLACELYDIQGNVISSDFSISLTSSEFNILNIGPQAIIDNSTITQNDFEDCYKYFVYVDVGGVSNSETYWIYMDTDCKRYTTHRLHWLNKLGSWDSFTFALVSTESATVQAFDYQRDPGVWDNTSYTYPLYSGQKIHFAKTKSETLVLNSDWINQDVQQWLVKSLYDSPLVYLEIPEVIESDCECVKVTFSYDGVDYEYNVPKLAEGYFELAIIDGDDVIVNIIIELQESFWSLSIGESINPYPSGEYNWTFFGESPACPKTDQWTLVEGDQVVNLTTSDCYINYEFKFEPVKVTNSSYTLKSRRKDGLIQETVNIERTFTYRSQIN